jgi:outer membrane translocation and assembly module TamA
MGSRWAAVCVLSCMGCASIESGRYGSNTLRLTGNARVSEAAIRACLISRERDRFGLEIGLSQPVCNVPPFDHDPLRIALWRWPWTEWPTFNRAVFDQDLERILRFYRARGYYDAKILDVRLAPVSAGTAAGRCDPASGDCRLDISIVVQEGAPAIVRDIAFSGMDDLPEDVRERARSSVELRVGQPIDETLHDASKGDIVRVLRQAGWAGASVESRVEVDTARGQASVAYRVDAGPLYRFGRLELSGQGSLPAGVIDGAAQLPSGERFDPDVLNEIQAEVFALGAFAAVEVEESLDPAREEANVQLRVSPLPLDALRVGLGVLSGTTRRETGEEQSIPQWDAHLFARYQRRHLFGSLGQLTLEDRPRLIFNAAFPKVEDPRPGNVASVGLDQPGLLEARTNAFTRAVWEYGPDPYLGFSRSDLSLRLGLTRGFWARRLLGTFALQQDIYSVSDAVERRIRERDRALESGAGEPSATEGEPSAMEGEPALDQVEPADELLSSSYRYAYLEQELRLDLREFRTRPRSGAFFLLNMAESPRWAGSDWAALRVAQEVRTYVPLPFDIVFAQRLAIAALFLADPASDLDTYSRERGPTSYRLRGGGASSNRGFLAGTLGSGLIGGVRRWESSLELRVPIGRNFVIAGFADIGDVNSRASYRFGHWNTTVGYGLRYFTLIGAIRLDVGHRVMPLQRLTGPFELEKAAGTLPFSDWPGAVHLTIGDPF